MKKPKPILKLINSEIKQEGIECLPCEIVNLDYERFSNDRDTEEHKATDVFENSTTKTSRILVKEIDPSIPPIFRFFLDGSRKTYKIADLLIRGKYLPVIAGQIGVAVVKREEKSDKIISKGGYFYYEKVMAFPDVISADDLNILQQKINDESNSKFIFLQYKVREERDPVDLGIAKIMSHMANEELKAVHMLSDKKFLSGTTVLVKDGPLRYKNIKGRGFNITQFRNVIGLSKSFRPSFAVGKGKKKVDVGIIASSLRKGERTPVYKTIEEDWVIGMWYLRIRPPDKMANPLQGVVKIECYAIDPEEKELGLDSLRVDNISAHVLRERNVTPYGQDSRWATHIYPIYLAETYIKDNFLSDLRFKAIF